MTKATHESPALVRALFLVALYAVLSPFLYEAQRLFPFQPGDQDWRFGAAGFLLEAMTTPTLGLAAGMALAWFDERFRLLRGIAVFAVLTSVVVAGTWALFLREFLQLRAGVPDQALGVFQAAGVRGLVMGGLSAVLLLLVGLAGLPVARRGLGEQLSSSRRPIVGAAQP